MKHHHLFLLVMSLLLMVTDGTAAVAESSRVVTTELTVAYQPLASPGGVIMQAMQHDRILRRELAKRGVALRFIPVGKGGDVIPMLQKGEAHFSTLGDMPLIEAANAVQLSVIGQLKRNYAMVVGPRGLSAGDLKGKRIGNAHASTGHFALLKILSSAGLTERDVTLVPLEVSRMPEALSRGQIDAFAAWEPTPSLTIARNPDRYGAIGRQQSLSFFVCNRSVAEQKPEVVKQIAASLVRAMGWFRSDRANVVMAARWNLVAMEVLTGTKSQVTEQELSKNVLTDLDALGYSPRMSRSLTSKRSLLLDELEFLRSLGKLPKYSGEAAVTGSFSFGVIENVLKKPKQYELSRFDYEP